MNRECQLHYSVEPLAHQTCQILITVPSDYVSNLYRYTLEKHRGYISTYGFAPGATPLSYLESTYKIPVLEYLKDFLLNHCIINMLLKNIIDHRTLISGEPELLDIKIDPRDGAEYRFKILQTKPEIKQDWKRVSFKAPQRKNYKDLDRQVESFIKDETAKSSQPSHTIDVGDWVCFDLYLLDFSGHELLPGYRNRLWLKISDEETDQESYALFHGKKKGDILRTSCRFLQQYMSPQHDSTHEFCIEIIDISHAGFFSLELFKKHFKIKTAKDLHQKLIEVFSHRNDISQRRESAEAAMKVLRDCCFLQLPESLIARQQDLVLSNVQLNPDYLVYKAQPDFKKNIRQLAEKQLKEAILIDHVSKQESVGIDHDDVMSYFNLLKRPRMKEFIYFDAPMPKIGGQEYPLSYELLRYYALREKTLNHMLYYLTAK